MCCCAVKRIEMNYAKEEVEKKLRQRETLSLSLSLSQTHIHTHTQMKCTDKEMVTMFGVKRECKKAETGSK